ncbi:hypothetical protein AB1Y20_019756 [Prymnesium parvum]|uniref:Glycosyl transferase family 25 domain-containing protein n=1 Tax=Prymnesium parvum TaxID=97485 RepID=A0AB34JWT7_PRYPA
MSYLALAVPSMASPVHTGMVPPNSAVAACTLDDLIANTFAITMFNSSRTQPVRERFLKEGIALRFIPGVNGTEMSMDEVHANQKMRLSTLIDQCKQYSAGKDSCDNINLDGFKAADLGCSMAHRNIFEEVSVNDVPCALVIEDDTIPVPHFKKKLQSLLSQLPPDFGTLPDTVKLDNTFEVLDAGGGHKIAGCAHGPPPLKQNNITLAEGPGICTSGYILSKKAAAAYRTLQSPLWLGADQIFNANFVQVVLGPLGLIPRVFHSVPQLVWQDPDIPSLLGHDIPKDKIPPNPPLPPLPSPPPSL